MVESSSLHFRHGMDLLLKSCSSLNVPLVIVSAAVSDVVETAVDKVVAQMIAQGVREVEREIVHVIANTSVKQPEAAGFNADGDNRDIDY